MYPLFDQSFRWGVFQLIKDIKNYHFSMNMCMLHLCTLASFDYGYFYSIFTFLRPTKAVENLCKAQWVLALYHNSYCRLYIL